MIKTQIVGYLGDDAVIREANGNKAIGFSLAHSESYKNADGQKVEKTVWFSCTHWNNKTGIAQYLTKGSLVLVDGVEEPTMYQSKQSGEMKIDRKVRVYRIELLNSTKKNEEQAKEQTAPATEPVADDLPF